ncbi:MAG: TetR/AcrR family transcriptional regulator [Myxococcota bacterium]
MVEPATARGRATRQALLDAAEEVFGEKRFAKAAITEITRRAGVAQGTFYVYFSSKEAIFSELVQHLGAALRRSLSEATSSADNRLSVEEAGIRAFMGFVAEHRNLYRIVRQAEFIDAAAYRAYYERFADGYVEGLRRAQQHGEVADIDLEALAYALMGASDFLGMRWVLWEEQPPPESAIQAVLHLLRHGLSPAR